MADDAERDGVGSRRIGLIFAVVASSVLFGIATPNKASSASPT